MKLKKKDYNKLLELLYQLRISSGLRQSDLADILKVHQSFISKLESGERQITVLEFIAYCETFKMNPVEIFAKLVNDINESESRFSKSRK